MNNFKEFYTTILQESQKTVKFENVKELILNIRFLISFSFLHLSHYAINAEAAKKVDLVTTQIHKSPIVKLFDQLQNPRDKTKYQQYLPEFLSFAHYLITNIKPFLEKNIKPNAHPGVFKTLDKIKEEYLKITK